MGGGSLTTNHSWSALSLAAAFGYCVTLHQHVLRLLLRFASLTNTEA